MNALNSPDKKNTSSNLEFLGEVKNKSINLLFYY